MARKTAKRHKQIHPGEVLRDDFLEPMGLTAYRLAKEIGVTAQHVGRIIHGQRGISADMALRLARFFGTSPMVWLNLQAQHDLDAAEDAAGRAIEKEIQPYRAAS